MFGKNFAELDSVWKENETTNFKNVLSKTQIISFFNRFKQLVYEVNSLKERLKQGDSNFTQLERTYQEFKNQYETNRKMIEIAENEKGILRTQNEEMVRQKREIENKIRDLESSLNTKERTIQNIRNENQRLNQTVQQKNTEISRLNSDLGVARESRVEKDKIKELESKREGLIKERDNYLNQIRQNESKWKTERDSLNSQINSLSVQISNWKSQSSNYQSQVYNLQNEISSLRSKSIDNLPTITIIRIDEIGIGIDNKTNTHSRFTLNYKNLIEYNKYLSSTGGGIYVGSSFGFKYRFLEIKAKFIRQNNELKWESNTDKVF